MEEHKPRRMERNKKGIPIPSFSCVSPSSVSLAKQKKKTTVEAPKWNQFLLSKAETALTVNRLRRGPTNKWSSEGRLPLDDFYVLCRQLALVETPKDGSFQDPDNLSMSERLLCDLVTVSSPSLYRLIPNDGKKEWWLEAVPYRGNRLAGLARLMNHPELDVAKHDATLKAILEHRAISKENTCAESSFETPVSKPGNNSNTQQQQRRKAIQEPFIQDNMTLEERVRARAQARKEREAMSKQKREKQDCSSLLRLADAMWSHSKRNTRRQSQLAHNKKSQVVAAAPFSMSVKDVVRLFSGSLVTSSSSLSSLKTSQLHRERATRAEMLQALRDLQRLVPEWISFSSRHLSKDTTVRLSASADIASVRTKLGAPKSTRHSKRPLNVEESSNKSVPRVSLSPLVSESSKSKTSADASTLSSPPPPSKKQRRSPRLASPLKRKRPAAQEDSSPSSPAKKSKPGLRINKKFILTNADNDGGMILKPSATDDPRGLKRLFSETNSGKRI